MFKLIEDQLPGNVAVIKVVGVGGGGGNALEYMVNNHIEGVEFISVNTDAQALASSSADVSLQIGSQITHGLGAGCNPEVGRNAAREDQEEIAEKLQGADMVFIATGMGGGTGTGAAPVIAEIARANGSLTIAVVTTPFESEGPKRMEAALDGIKEIGRHVDSLIIVPNQKLTTVFGKISILDAFAHANQVLHSAVQGIAELITCRGLINLDFADVKTVMSETGTAMIGAGCASGESRAYEAANSAISNPLLDDIDLSNASGLLVNITSGTDIGLDEYDEVAKCMNSIASGKANTVIGVVIDEAITDEFRVTLVATGLDGLSPEPAKMSRENTDSQETVSAWDNSRQEASSITNELGANASSAIGSEQQRIFAAEPAEDTKLSLTAHRQQDVSINGDEEDLDIPSVLRHREDEDNSVYEEDDLPQVNSNEEYLDIPAFLRQQVD